MFWQKLRYGERVELKILRGIPASGKSTYAHEWLAVSPETRAVVARDDIREQLFGFEYHTNPNKEAEEQVTEVEHGLLRKYLTEGRDVISDGTNLVIGFLENKIALGKEHGATITYLDFPISLQEAKQRNRNRKRQVPEFMLDRMFNRLGPEGQFPVFPGSYPTKPLNIPVVSGLGSRNPAVCFDMDGTLNDVRRLQPFLMGRRRDFDSFHRMSEFEPANESVVTALRSAADAGLKILITTARQEKYRETTQKWLDDRGIPYENIFMRRQDDFRPDYEVKKDIFDFINDFYDIVRCYDDNPQAIRAWEEKGVRVTKIPFINDPNSDYVVNVPDYVSEGRCMRCGRDFKGPGVLGPTCITKVD